MLKKKNAQAPVVETEIINALGICYYCKYIEETQKHIEFTSPEYKETVCKKIKKPCYIARETIVSCHYFKIKRENILTKIFRLLFK